MGASQYITDIRAKIGHQLLLLPTVSVLPWDEDGRLLLARSRELDQWMTIGGMVEPDESPQQAACREAREEAGIELELIRIRAVRGGPSCRIRYPNGDLVSTVTTVFDARVTSGDPRADEDETSDVRWFSADQLDGERVTAFTDAMFSELSLWDTRSATNQ